MALFGGSGFSGGSVANPIIAAVGSVSAPTFTFEGDTATGLYRPFATMVGVTVNGAGTVAWLSDKSQHLRSDGQYAWSSSATPGSAADTGLSRPSAGVVKVTDGSTGSGAINIKRVAGAVSDGSFSATPADGTMALDETNKKIYVRLAGAWVATAALT